MGTNKVIFTACVFLLMGCGVKGRPLPPLVPAPIGRGEPGYTTSTSKKNPVKNKYNYQLEEKSEDKASSSKE